MTIQIGYIRRYADRTEEAPLGLLDEFYGLHIEGDMSALPAEAQALIAAAETEIGERNTNEEGVKHVAHALADQLKGMEGVETPVVYTAFRGDDLESYKAALASNRKRQWELANQAAEVVSGK